MTYSSPIRFGDSQAALQPPSGLVGSSGPLPGYGPLQTASAPQNQAPAQTPLPPMQSADYFTPSQAAGVSNQPGMPPAGLVSVFDRFQLAQCYPSAQATPLKNNAFELEHPLMTHRLQQADQASPTGSAEAVIGESPADRLMMYRVVNEKLKGKSRDELSNLRDRGILDNFQTDDGHSTLYHLYAMVTTPRQEGYRGEEILRETVEILNRPYVITQHFSPLSDTASRQILQLRQHPELDPQAGRVDNISVRPVTPEELKVKDSATCVASSVMYQMAQQEPGELARHINELTSPMNAFYEKASLREISPDDPSKAVGILQQNGIPYHFTGPDQVTVKVTVPTAGVIRAINDQKAPKGHKDRNAVESIYQSALTHLATNTYDPATDLRGEADDPKQTSKGLTEDEKSLMETIVKESGGVQSVTYQAVSGKQNPKPGEEGNAYLYGYNRTFQQTAADIITALQNKHFVIVGLTDTDKKGCINGGHEITLTQAFTDSRNGELEFVVADSDDDIPKLAVRSAREIIPRIHHAGLPLQQARQIKPQIAQLPGPLVPDEGDAQAFTLLNSYNPFKNAS